MGFFLAFDLLAVDGEDLGTLPLVVRKRRHRRIMPRIESRLRFMEHIEGRGIDLFRAACDRDLEGIVGNWSRGSYLSDGTIDLVGEDHERQLLTDGGAARAF